MSYYYSLNNSFNSILNQGYPYNFEIFNYEFTNAMRLMQNIFQFFVLMQQLDYFLNSQNLIYNTPSNDIFNWGLPSYFDPKKPNYTQINEDFNIPSFSDIDINRDEKIQKDEFKDFYVKQREKNNNITYNSVSPELAKIKKEAENIYNAIKGDDEVLGKERYSAFIDIIDETDGILDKKYYQKDAQILIDKIKNQPQVKIKDNKTLVQLISEKLGQKIDYTKKRDFDIEQVYQGEISNCFILSALAKHPEFIKDSGCLRWNDDGSADVFLYNTEEKIIDNHWKTVAVGDKKCYHITKDELEKTKFELIKNNGEKQEIKINEKQDFTLKALDIGFLKYCDFNYEKVKESGGHLSKTIKMLFGNEKYKDMTYYCNPGKYNVDDLKDCIGAFIRKTSETDKKRNIGGKIIPTWHLFTFNGYNPQTKMVSISNPWKNDLNSKDDDIEIPWEQFKDNFTLQLLTDKKSQVFTPFVNKCIRF